MSARARARLSSLLSPRLRRVLVWVAVALAGVYLLYMGVANAVIGGGRLGRMLSHEPEKVRIQYASASTFWFGRVHVEGLDIRMRDEKVEWEVHADRAEASVSLFALLAHRFHTSRLEGQGVSFRMRLRRDAAALPPEKAERLPPIDGFPPRPIAGDPPLPPPDPHAHPFTIALDGMDLHAVREVWLDTFRLTGDLAVRGGFTLAPRDHFEVAPTHVEVRDATLATGADVVVASVEGGIDARIEPVPQSESSAPGVLRRLSSRSALEGDVGGISFLRSFLPPGLAPKGGEGRFRGTLVVDRGVVTEESSSHVEQGPMTLSLPGGLRVTARATTDVTATSDDAGRAGHVTIALADVVLAGHDGKRVATSAATTLHASLDETDLAAEPRDFHYAWNTPRTVVEDLRVVNAAMGHEDAFRIEQGSATVATSGHGSLEGLEARARIDSVGTMTVQGARIASRIDADVAAKADFAHARDIAFTGTTLALSDVAVGHDQAHPGWTGRVRLDEAVVHFKPAAVDLVVSTTGRDGRPALDFYGAMKDVSPAIKTALAIVPDAAIESATANLVASCRLHVAKDAFALRDLEVRGATTRVRGTLTKRGESKQGAFLFEAGPAAIGLAIDNGGARPILADAPAWYERTRAASASPPAAHPGTASMQSLRH